MTHNLFSLSFKNQPEAAIVDDLELKAKAATANLINQIRGKKIPPIEIVFNRDDLGEFEDLAKRTSGFEKIVILGVGGSSLGAKTILSLEEQQKIEFLESIDPATIKNFLDKIDYQTTFFLVISKSGETIETICQTLIILNQLRALGIKEFSKQFLFVTQSEENSIAKIAKNIGAKIANHPSDIGGRFSCFSIVGLLPALLAGIDIKKIRLGAQKLVESFLSDPDEILRSCLIQLFFYDHGFGSSVIMPYVDNLKNFTDWYRQLWAESLGKSGFGSTPINSMGTVDQHSQLQLYLDGPRDKFFTFITKKNQKSDFAIKDLQGCKTMFGGKNLSEILKVEQETTIEILNQKKLQIRIFLIYDV